MNVRFSVVWLVLGLGVSISACGSTRKQPGAVEPDACQGENCPNDCESSTRFCFEGKIWKCAADGKSAAVVQLCAENELCEDAGQFSRCRAMVDGMGGAPSVACTPGALSCGEGQVLACSSDGASLELYDPCEPGEVCDPATLACAASSCEPGSNGCLGTKPALCNDAGTAFEPVGPDCFDDGQACDGGECVELGCAPLAKRCADQTVMSCDASGLQETAAETCGLYQHCVETPASGAAPANAYCVQNACQPGMKLCDGNVVKLCTDQAELPTDGEDCGDSFCANGACLPKICEPFELLCVGNEVHDCGHPGTTTTLRYACGDDRCRELADTVGCGPRACQAGETVCLGNALGTCADDGESLSQVTQNCASTQQVCSATPACADSVVETLGVNENVEALGSSEVLGNIIDVHSSRRLTKLEAHFVLDAPRDVRWLVYELGADGAFELVASEITLNAEGSGFAASQELSWVLEAGKRYLLGVGLVVYEGYLYYDEAPHDGSFSFANLVGGTRNGYSSTMFFDPNRQQLYRLRVTTELP